MALLKYKIGGKINRAVLNVYTGNSLIGTLSLAPGKHLSFGYDPDWLSSEQAFPVSLSMPLSDRVWVGGCVASFFDGLLPDDENTRQKIASHVHAESSGTFDLLSTIGQDCAGALRFIPEGLDPGDPAQMRYRPVSNEEIAKQVASLETAPLGLQPDEEDFRFALAGVQKKTAFLRVDGQWQLPLGSTPSSHIFKPAIKDRPSGADLSDVPWNEWLCLALCRALGVESANAEVLMFDDKPVFVVERFDRFWRDQILYRLPQEDLCQALSIPSMQKYQADGGPSILDILEFLNGAAAPRKERLTFMKAQIVFWLLAAIDGHAKNYSVFLAPEGYRLTPIYDVMSAAPYPELLSHKVKLVMSVGDSGLYRIEQISPRHFYETGRKGGVSEEDMDEIFSQLAAQVENAVEEVGNLIAKTGMPKKTSQPILEGVRTRARLIQ